jgi:DNA-binding response OmpR family regulator
VCNPAGHRLSASTGSGSLGGALRVLVIEDELKLAALIRKALNEQGMTADFARGDEDALQMATASPYDVVLLDVNLPGIDGFGVCRRLRAQGVDTPILMLTAGDRIDELSADIDACADDYMAKPFDLNELFARVRGLARRERE